jgi:succinate dehydrogenase/fumarate reductase flavoprotein subunit
MTYDSVDAVIIGGGLAGMTAAAAAAEHGAAALVLERAPTIGGSAAISGGYVWTANDGASLRREDSGEFQRHGHIVVAGYAGVSAWLAALAPPLTDEQPNLHGRGRKFDLPLLIATMARRIHAAGGSVSVGNEVVDIERDGDAFSLSVESEGGSRVVRTRALVLASGGRQADPAVRRSLVDGGDVLPVLRGNAYSRGDGAAIAVSLGASTNFANKGFYGHLFADGVQPVAPLDFIAFALYHSEEGVMFDHAGRRFADEARGDHNNTMAVAEHGGRALLLWSEDVQERAGGRPFVGGSLPMDRWGFSRDRGGRADSAAGAAALLPIVRSWGYELQLDALEDGDVRERLGSKRIFAADVVPAVTMTFGGIEVDGDGRAVDGDGSPIAGLYVAGGDTSDVYHRGYAGGLCAAAVTGRRAGEAVARSATAAHSAA